MSHEDPPRTPSPSPNPSPEPPNEEISREISEIKRKLDEAWEERKEITAAYQEIYYSMQFWKVDPSIGTIAPEVMTFAPNALEIDPNLIRLNERGLSIAGVEVFKNPFTTWLEGTGVSSEARRRKREGIRSDSESQEETGREFRKIKDIQNEIKATLTRHTHQIRNLASGHRDLAQVSRTGATAQRAAAEGRRQTNIATGRPTRAGQDAHIFRQMESALKALENQARSLAGTL
ncbi:hypothetical protein [Streptomyces corynorhini]|uniref:hypothetical protein n=1 Tax=Streptomyces corynorhini TaxID=2282652 RepID=UPI0011C022E9|nr:hypothetical protein [Streptomyces corynorhini]